MFFLWSKADAITKSPCQICAERHGSQIICTLTGTGEHISRFYEPNGTSYTATGVSTINISEIELGT